MGYWVELPGCTVGPCFSSFLHSVYEVTSVVSSPWWCCGLMPSRLLGPWDSPGKNTGVCCRALPPGDLPDPEIEPMCLMWIGRRILYRLCHLRRPYIVVCYVNAKVLICTSPLGWLCKKKKFRLVMTAYWLRILWHLWIRLFLSQLPLQIYVHSCTRFAWKEIKTVWTHGTTT